MNVYENGLESKAAAELLNAHGQHRLAVYHCCLAAELFLKSKLALVEHNERLDESHDIIGIYAALTKRFNPVADISAAVKMLRKYFNESRYPASPEPSYTTDFANEFVGYMNDVKDYVDDVCIAGVNDLLNKYNK